MKTAMQELSDNLNAMQIDGIIQLSPIEEEMITYMFNKALEKEKEQIIDFTNSFYDDCVTEGGSLKQSAEDYYNKTYNQNP
jgi:hypothetical protein